MMETLYPLSNVPFGIISSDENPLARPATIIENVVIDLAILEQLGAFHDIDEYPESPGPLQAAYLNEFAALSKTVRSAVRSAIQKIWQDRKHEQKYQEAFLPVDRVQNHVPMQTINYTDYVSSQGHFENLQVLAKTPLSRWCPFYHMPMGYYGNSRNIVINGTPVYRFYGTIDRQFQKEEQAETGLGRNFDYELELGVYLCGGKKYGESIRVEEADDYIFGVVLLNDWSCRDIQRAESGGPTGPFLAKSGCVSISPWIVTLDALEVARLPRQLQPVVPFADHLSEERSSSEPCLDIRCSVFWKAQDGPETEVSRASYSETYWTYRQLLAHQTANGSVTGSGDLIGTGTMSMLEGDDLGRCCAAERTYFGSKPVDIGAGQKRTWIEDGDEIILRGWVHDPKTGAKLLGFGECRGVVMALNN